MSSMEMSHLWVCLCFIIWMTQKHVLAMVELEKLKSIRLRTLTTVCMHQRNIIVPCP
ncbi:hypothetical protein CsSME_00016429 [Camellia sinensis var. sinensis]